MPEDSEATTSGFPTRACDGVLAVVEHRWELIRDLETVREVRTGAGGSPEETLRRLIRLSGLRPIEAVSGTKGCRACPRTTKTTKTGWAAGPSASSRGKLASGAGPVTAWRWFCSWVAQGAAVRCPL